MNEPKNYWYQCQERAMAPGVADGWPKVIPAPHTPNGRLIRCEGPSPDELRRRFDQLREVVEKLPKTKDGVRVVPGVDDVFCLMHAGNGEYYAASERSTSPRLIALGYSTREAAEAALASRTNAEGSAAGESGGDENGK